MINPDQRQIDLAALESMLNSDGWKRILLPAINEKIKALAGRALTPGPHTYQHDQAREQHAALTEHLDWIENAVANLQPGPNSPYQLPQEP